MGNGASVWKGLYPSKVTPDGNGIGTFWGEFSQGKEKLALTLAYYIDTPGTGAGPQSARCLIGKLVLLG